MVEASQSEASLAVRLYNDPAEPRNFEGFVVHMHLAWLYLLHAELTRDGRDIRYRQPNNPRRLLRIDGEPKQWGLGHCVADRWTDRDPVRLNIEFFIALRNRIEHRPRGLPGEALSAALGGHAQALLLNYEHELVSQFSQAASMATRLRFPIFIGSFTDEGETTLRRLRNSLPAALRTFIAEHESGLPSGVIDDSRYEFRLRVTNELAPKDPDALALQFTRYDDMTQAEKDMVESLGKKGMVVVREQKRDVVGKGLRKPGQVIAEVQRQIPYKFHQGHFLTARIALRVRPAGSDDPHPERTDDRYCIYDDLNRNYGYTDAYTRKLVKLLSTPKGFLHLLGEWPKDKERGALATEDQDPASAVSAITKQSQAAG